ncbi:hypothetical protein D6783_05995 [Candidatus Woesearchaeota archaeon]|nr:MAG: hypothetical protein D6783_05995 [Candidatus Woesearchaeota archaeon]
MNDPFQPARANRLNTLSDVLGAYGFAASASEAKRMAEEIMKTEAKALKDFSAKKEANTMYCKRRTRSQTPTNHNPSQNDTASQRPRNRFYEENIARLRHNALQSSKVEINTAYETPRTSTTQTTTTRTTPAPQRAPATNSPPSSTVQEPPPMTNKPLNNKENTFKEKTTLQQPSPAPLQNAPANTAANTPVQPSTPQQSKPATPSMRGEENVDLSDIFNFSKR